MSRNLRKCKRQEIFISRNLIIRCKNNMRKQKFSWQNVY